MTVNALNAHEVSSKGAHGLLHTVDSTLYLRISKALSQLKCPEKLVQWVRKQSDDDFLFSLFERGGCYL